MSSKEITEEVKKKVEEIVQEFNSKAFSGDECYYLTRYKKNYLYLDRNKFGDVCNICRLKYNGNMKSWDFAIFKYSSEEYSPDECFFPGEEFIDGTIEGAMKAGLKAYPV